MQWRYDTSVSVREDFVMCFEAAQELESHAAYALPQAKLVTWADKICNLRDILSSPPSDWPIERKQEYFDWAAKVVAGVRDGHPGLASVFDQLYARRPK